MDFDSYKYLIFLPIVYAVFYVIGKRFRWLWLVLASFCFYAFLQVPYLLFVLFAVAFINHILGIVIEEGKTAIFKRAVFWAGIAVNILILGYLKYLPFLIENISGLLPQVKSFSVTNLAFIGVSFYIFQAISYLIDIYLETIKAERHFGYFLLYLSFFPKLLLGPIERAGDLIPQLRAEYKFDYDNMRWGLLMCLWGIFKKVVVADRLAVYVNTVYADPHSYTGISLITATYFYAFQIYSDFSGYTDIALGTARMFNLRLTQNFNSPYLARSIADFWRRWHISFSRWLFDYIFNPLQMLLRKALVWGTVTAFFITFFISGAWHGAAWHYIVWGMIFGLYLGWEVFYRPIEKKIFAGLRLENTFIQNILQVVITFNMVCLAWIFFRAKDCAQAFYIVSHLHSGVLRFLSALMSNIGSFSGLNKLMTPVFLTNDVNFLACIFLVGVVLCEQVARNSKAEAIINGFFLKPLALRWIVYIVLTLAVFNLGKGNDVKFIYYSF